jgi:hypothetical protein
MRRILINKRHLLKSKKENLIRLAEFLNLDIDSETLIDDIYEETLKKTSRDSDYESFWSSLPQ